MIELTVTDEEIAFAKNQIAEFTRSEAGNWRYDNVEAWRGVVCEMIVSKWLEENFDVQVKAKGIDTSGNEDDYDLKINEKKVEIKSATKNYFRYLMPKIHDLHNKPKDIYIGAKYNETVEPNKVYILGYILRDDILKYPVRQNKGAPYYEVPLTALKEINEQTFL